MLQQTEYHLILILENWRGALAVAYIFKIQGTKSMDRIIIKLTHYERDVYLAEQLQFAHVLSSHTESVNSSVTCSSQLCVCAKDKNA